MLLELTLQGNTTSFFFCPVRRALPTDIKIVSETQDPPRMTVDALGVNDEQIAEAFFNRLNERLDEQNAPQIKSWRLLRQE